MNPMLEMMSNSSYIEKLYEKSFCNIRNTYGVSQLELDILGFLKNNPQVDTASDIIKYRMLPKANVSLAVEQLIQRGYLQRQQDADDRRKIHLSILPEAEELVDAILKTQKIFLETLFGDFSPEERKQYMKMNHRIFRNVKKGLES